MLNNKLILHRINYLLHHYNRHITLILTLRISMEYLQNNSMAHLYKDSERRHLVSVMFNKNQQYIKGRLNLGGKATADVSHQIPNDFL